MPWRRLRSDPALGLSATIHFLNRLHQVRVPGEDTATAVERATVLVGPALIVTSVVLTCGLGVTVLSDLPSLRVFGWVSALAMVAALVGDLLILRPTITLLERWAACLAPDPAMSFDGRVPPPGENPTLGPRPAVRRAMNENAGWQAGEGYDP